MKVIQFVSVVLGMVLVVGCAKTSTKLESSASHRIIGRYGDVNIYIGSAYDAIDLSRNQLDTNKVLHFYNELVEAYLLSGKISEADSIEKVMTSYAGDFIGESNFNEILLARGRILDRRSRFSSARDLFVIGLEGAEIRKNPDQLMRFYYELSNTYVNIDDAALIGLYADSCLQVAKSQNDSIFQSLAKINLCYAGLSQGDFKSVRNYLDEIAINIDESETYLVKTYFHFVEGLYFYALEEVAASRLSFEKAKREARKSNSGLALVQSDYFYYGTERDQSRLELAIDSLGRAAENSRRIGDYRFEAAIYRHVGYLNDQIGAFSKAYDAYLRSLATADNFEIFSEASLTRKFLIYHFEARELADSAMNRALEQIEVEERQNQSDTDLLLSVLNTRYKVDLKDEQIHTQQVLVERNRAQRNLAIFVGVFGFALILIVGYSYRRKLKRDYALKKERIRNELLSLTSGYLKNQIGNHYFMNIAQRTVGLVSRDPHEAQVYLQRISRFLQGVLELSNDTVFTSLENEIEMIKDYVAIESTTFGAEICLEIQLEKGINANQIQVLPLMFQPFVENCIKHGFAEGQRDPEIKIVIKAEGSWLAFTVEDNGNQGHKLANTHGARKGNSLTEKRIQVFNSYIGGSEHFFTSKSKGLGWIVNFKLRKHA